MVRQPAAGSAVSSPRRLQRIARFAGGQRLAAAKRGARDTLGTRLGRSARRAPWYAVPLSRPESRRYLAARRAAIGRGALHSRSEGKTAGSEEACGRTGGKDRAALSRRLLGGATSRGRLLPFAGGGISDLLDPFADARPLPDRLGRRPEGRSPGRLEARRAGPSPVEIGRAHV